MPIEAIIFDRVKGLVFDAVKKQVSYQLEPFFLKRKIESKLEDSVAKVVEPLIPFFEAEKIDDDKKSIMIDHCVRDLHILLEKPDELFAASLDGQKVFERVYPSGVLPQAIREEGLEHPYSLLFPRIAHLICSYPAALKAWEVERYRDDFRRLDEIARTLGDIGKKVEALATHGSQSGDRLLSRLQQTLAQRVEFQLELTALRADQPYAGKMEDLFVVPELHFGSGPQPEKIGNRDNNINKFVERPNRSIVNGPPGAGKSTWLQWLQRLFLEQTRTSAAILVRLREYAGTELPSLFDLVRRVAGTHMSEELTTDVIRSWLDAGQLAFLFDGFDEISPAHRDSMLSWIEDLAQIVSTATIIVTSRPLTTNHLDVSLETWERCHMQPFNRLRIVEYIERWYKSAPLLKDDERKVNAASLATTWVNDPALSHLTGNPLMLSTLLMVNHLDGELPRGRAKLYERYINGMLGLWDKKRKIPTGYAELTTEEKLRVLVKIALHLQLSNEDQIGENALQELTSQILNECRISEAPTNVLRMLVERTGLLIGPGDFSFVHKSVGEFLVAQVRTYALKS